MSVTGADLLAAHLAAMAQGFGSSEVAYDGQTTRGLLDDEESLTDTPEGIRRNRERVLTLPVASLTARPTADSTIRIDGTSYKVRAVELQGDGLHWRILVA